MKRLLDVLGAVVGLAVLAPLFLAAAALVTASSPGPVLFRSRRLGRNGVPFDMLKFRTMYVGSSDIRNPDGSTYSGADDPRVTRTGIWLRKTSLDELPQLLNVLRGDMSLVGPRPDLIDHASYYSPEDWRRLNVRPGITGLAQVSGRNGITWAERRVLDLEYVDRQSVWYDLNILFRTVPAVFQARGVFAGGQDRSR